MTTTFSQSENSNYGGRPVNLYKFTRGSVSYLYAESDRDVTLGDDTYSTVDVSDDGVSMTGNSTTDTFEITMPSSAAVVQLYNGTAPSDSIYVTVRRYHPGDADAAVYYVGTLASVTQTTPGVAKMSCAALSGSFRRDGLRIAWERGCPYSLYDRNCRVDQTLYAVPAVVIAVVGNQITVPVAARYVDNWFAGGYFEWQNLDRSMERRGIELQYAAQMLIFGQGDGITRGMNITMYPGCGRVTSICSGKFNNLANYGGVPMLPGKSPFDGDPVF